VTVLLGVSQADVIRHAVSMPDVAKPPAAFAIDMPMVGRQLRLVDLRDPNDPEEIGPPVLDAWLHYDPIPTRPDLAMALVAHFTGHLSISTTMRPHAGVGTALAHDSISTAVMSINVVFHDPTCWDGWLLYHHESTHAGGGMSFVDGHIFTEDGRLLASFNQEGMIRAFAPDEASAALSVESRL